MTATDANAAAKAAARRAAFARRKAAHADDGAAKAADAARRFLGDVAVDAGEIVAVYAPIRTEIDVWPLADALAAAGGRLCLPVIRGERLPLRFRAWSPGAPLVDGPFGARVPADGDDLRPSLVVAPLVAFDRSCARLGYGGGFYDRSLAELDAADPTRRPRAVGFAYAAQESPTALPVEATDRLLDAVVTEVETIRRIPLSHSGATR